MRILYVDCFSGISGDMTIGALLDAGASFHSLESQLALLQLEQEYQLSIEKVMKNGIHSNKFHVMLKEEHTHQHSHHHGEPEDHHHHHHDNHSHSHHHRTYQDIVKLIDNSELDDKVKSRSLEMFRVIGEAEAKIHGMDIAQVHFHEVGAIDSIIDIVGTAILLEELAVDRMIAAPVPVGSGHIHIDHGVYPVPAPATLEVLKGIPLAKSSIKGELTTPTGAAIIKTQVDAFSTLPTMRVDKIGYGAGTKTFKDHPNVLRVVIGED
ncbi:LarC family nickel insertion protein [Gracilibacillus salinarum]|uniref:LarC family nickel insertion protein n=1 Tax=Gracilibacillus salinarum TaxID=2932255 RepID=A0ABY4GSF9_9BACI|nr:LarC family nickel insertion protein [Gracilibacillus salinarum]UOQ87310.1 LarC family nickel insertion protein [Gracilibacillus salinarum]